MKTLQSYLGLLGILFLFCGFSAQAQEKKAKQVSLADVYVGQSIIIPVEDPDSVVIDRRDVVNYMEDLPPDETRPVLTALAAGTAHITVAKGGETTIYTVTVRNPQQNDQADIIKELVNDPGLQVRFVGDAVVLYGEIENDLMAKRAVNVASAFASRVMNFLTIKEPMQVRIKVQVVQVDINKLSQIGIRYQADNSQSNSTSIYGPSVGMNIFQAGPAPFFRVFNSNGQLGGPDMTAILDLAMQDNVIKILQEPTLTVMNGQSAVFRVGGEVPIVTFTQTDTGTTYSVEYRPFGISLLVTPVLEEQTGISTTGSADAYPPNRTLGIRDSDNIPRLTNASITENGYVSLFVRPEVSEVDFETLGFTLTDGTRIPGFRTKVVETRVSMKHKNSLVIGGLFDDQTTKTLQSVPFVSKIPIIGEIFKDRANTGDHSELMFVLTPQIIGKGFDSLNEGVDANQSTVMAQQMRDFNVLNSAAKPTRISAQEVFVRKGEATPEVAPAAPESQPQLEVRPMESTEVLPMDDAGKPASQAEAAPTEAAAPQSNGVDKPGSTDNP